MKSNFKVLLFAGLLAICTFTANAQDKDYNPIEVAVPSLMIAPDARAGGMGDAGVATAHDVYSQHWNPAKYAFAISHGGFALSYTPWLRKIVNDVALMNAVGYYKIGSGDNQAISASIRYFTIGDVNVKEAQNQTFRTVSPYEMAIDVSYSRKLTSTFSGAVSIRYIRADYSGADNEGSPGNVFAADIAGYNESYINLGHSESLLSFGFNISNIGGKISNNDGQTSSFIPTNLRLGASLMYPMNEVSTLSFSVDLNKLLVPTPPKRSDYENTEEGRDQYQKKYNDYIDGSSIGGIFKSFGGASFSEKMKEITWSLGAEYDYDSKFRVRTGYFHESKMKGNRRYMAFGAGFKLSAFQLDAAYLLSTAQTSPLDQTLRFSLAFDIDGLKQLFNN